tara:strand:- start:42044 stop:42631 length:588 start_codon:yes stop_codon:yes gene_type:complete
MEDIIMNRPIKKIRRKRNLTEAQRQVLRDRINKARENKKTSANLTIHEDIRFLPDDHPLSPKKVKGWIKTCKDKLSGMKNWNKSNDSKQRDAFNIEDTYLSNLQSYLRDGVYKDLFYGEHHQHLIKYRVRKDHMAYNADGTPKRSVGFFYEDIGAVYTQEMYEDDNPTIKPYRKRKSIFNKSKIYKTNRKYRKRS